jgi:putative flippase GtrA
MQSTAQRWRELLGQLARFAGVGLTNTLLSLAIYTLLGRWVDAPVAGAAAFAAGALNGYVLNRAWTFRAPDTGGARVRYVVVQVCGLAFTTAMLYFLVTLGSMGRFDGYAFTLPAVTLGTFAANRTWTFAA